MGHEFLVKGEKSPGYEQDPMAERYFWKIKILMLEEVPGGHCRTKSPSGGKFTGEKYPKVLTSVSRSQEK